MRVARTAHFYSLGKASTAVTHLWIVCHGYGQLASTFIEAFDGLADERTLILAPEGLSRFYWGGLTGPVVASWMTSRDRLHEIEDYAGFLQQLYDAYLPRLHPDCRISLLGFSQGCATQVRWLMARFPAFDDLILWAGTLPEDLDYRPHRDYFEGKQLHLVYGKHDPLIKPGRLNIQRDFIRAQGLPFREHAFEGRHELNRELLLDWVREGMGSEASG